MQQTESQTSAAGSDPNAGSQTANQNISDPYTITVMVSVEGMNLCKVFTAGAAKPEGYGKAKFFKVLQYNVSTFAAFVELLAEAERCNVFIVRGDPIPGTDMTCTLRRIHDDQETGEKATFTSCDRAWIMCDWDKPPVPGAPDLVTNPAGAVDFILAQMPPEMRAASCWWQLGNSAGINPNKFSLHIWFLLDRPVSEADLKGFFTAYGFDPTMSRAIQPHYIHKPVFNGLSDPCPIRSGIRRGQRDTMDASPIISHGATHRRVQAEKMRVRQQESARALALHALRGHAPSAVDLTTVEELMAGPFAGIVTEEGGGGWLHCDCPNHASSSSTSLHINIGTGQWRCHGCDQSGGTAFDLALFLNGGDRGAAMAGVYNIIDGIAEATGASIVLIHHTSKGNQSEKAVTDVGAGAGSISRAADTHLTLREHEDENRVVMEAETRSSKRPDPIVLERVGLSWQVDALADPAKIKTKRAAPTGATGVAVDAGLDQVLPQYPTSITEIRAMLAARDIPVSDDRLRCALKKMEMYGKAVSVPGPRLSILYGRELRPDGAGVGTKVQQCQRYLASHPNATGDEVVAACKVDERTVRRAKEQLRVDQEAEKALDSLVRDSRSGADK